MVAYASTTVENPTEAETAAAVLCHRVDALTVAYRVKLSARLLKYLRGRGDVAKKHGRSQFVWNVRVPDDEPGSRVDQNGRRLYHGGGPIRLRWASEADRVRKEAKIWGELRYSRADRCWRVTNEGYMRLQIVMVAAGGGALRDCALCEAEGTVEQREGLAVHHVVCPVCNGARFEEEPGWTLEIIWYAERLAAWGLEKTLAESAAMAANLGEVLETRLRRLDLCADVVGWDVNHDELLERLVKRPHAEWRLWNESDDAEKSEAYADELVVPRAVPLASPKDYELPASKRKKRGPKGEKDRDADRVAIYGRGSMQRRKVTGLVVGRGPFMCRIYDKRAELDRLHGTAAERREREESRWREAKDADGRSLWDGEAPVTRVEFQLRNVALTEFGIRDPDAVVVPVSESRSYVDARGKRRVRDVVTGHALLTVTDPHTGEERQATVCDRLDDLWRACLAWVRLVVPSTTRGGKMKPPSRLDDDPRWALLRAIRFTDHAEPRAIRRHRPRAAASWAMGLGVALSQAGRDGRLREIEESRQAWERDPARSATYLRRGLLRLYRMQASGTYHAMMAKFGTVAEACEHFAIRNNATHARFHRGVEEGDEDDSGSAEGSPAIAAASS